MANESLFPNGGSSSGAGTWGFTGGSNLWDGIDNGIATPVDGEFDSISGASVEDTVLTLDLTSTTIADADTVTNIDIKIRADGVDADDGLDVNLVIGGTGQGVVSQAITSTTTDYTLNTAAWNSDWTAAQLNGAQVTIANTQAGMPTSSTWTVYEVEVDITFTPASADYTAELSAVSRSRTVPSLDVEAEIDYAAELTAVTRSRTVPNLDVEAEIDYAAELSAVVRSRTLPDIDVSVSSPFTAELSTIARSRTVLDISVLGFPNGWGRKVSLTSNTSLIAGSGSHTDIVVGVFLTNLPVESVDNGSNSAQVDGDDFAFSYDIDGLNRIEVQKVEFVADATAGNRKAVFWLKIDSLSTSVSKVIYAWYKNASASFPAFVDRFGRNAVWSDYKAVLHLNESGDGTSGEFEDSTGNGFTGKVARSTSSQVTTDHPFGSTWQELDGVDDYIVVENSDNFLDDAFITVSCWFEPLTVSGDDQGLVGNWESSQGNNYFQMTVTSFGGGSNYRLHDGTGSNSQRGATPSADTVYMKTEVTTTDDLFGYVDGVEDANDTSIAGDNQFNSALLTKIGTYFDLSSTRSLHCRVGEVRFIIGSDDVDRILTEKNNVKDASTFWTTGTPVSTTGFTADLSAVGRSRTVPDLDVEAEVDYTAELNAVARSRTVPSLDVEAEIDYNADLDAVARSRITPSLDVEAEIDYTAELNSVSRSRTIPSLDISVITDFTGELSAVVCSRTLPLLDIEAEIDFTAELGVVAHIRTVPDIDVSVITSFNADLSDIARSRTSPALDIEAEVDYISDLSAISRNRTIPFLDVEAEINYTAALSAFVRSRTLHSLDIEAEIDYLSYLSAVVRSRTIPSFDIEAEIDYNADLIVISRSRFIPNIDITLSAEDFYAIFNNAQVGPFINTEVFVISFVNIDIVVQPVIKSKVTVDPN